MGVLRGGVPSSAPVSALEDEVVSSNPVVAALKEGRGKEFDLGPIVGFQDVAFQASGTVRQLPCPRRLVALHVERDTMQGQFGPVHPVGRPPDQNPVVVTGDSFAGRVDLGLAVDFGSCRDNQFTVMPNVLGDETDDRRFDFSRVDRDNGFAWNHPSVGRVGI